MGYFKKGLFDNTRTFWLLMGYMALWIFGIMDLFYRVTPGGKSFYVILTLNIGGLVGFLIYKYRKDETTRKKTEQVEKEAAISEPEREKEIRRIYEQNPEFATHCYECQYYLPDLQQCGRKLAKDVADRRLKEIYIGKRKFCLYWTP